MPNKLSVFEAYDRITMKSHSIEKEERGAWGSFVETRTRTKNMT